MRTRSFIAAVIVAVWASPCFAEAWVSKMLSETKHDFGTVARGADTSHKFAIKNIYKQEIELLSVRSSCGCTSPTIDKKILKTGDVGYVTAVFNTRTFTGVHGATLTVEVRWNDNGNWVHGETQLRVDGNIRGDIVFTPGAVKFDEVEQGARSEQKVQVKYSGRSSWKITDVRGASEALEVELTQTQRYSGYVTYDLLVRLKGTAPAGYFNDQLVLVTNDDENPRVPMYVSGRVVPQISVSPESVLLNDVAHGQQVTKKIIVRGKKPFKITNIACDDQDCFQFKTDDQASNKHIVEIIFSAKKNAGMIKEPVRITTDLGEKFTTSLTVFATIIPSPPATTTTETKSTSAAVGAGSVQGNVARQ